MGLSYRITPYFDELPEELIQMICSHMDRNTLAIFLRVNCATHRIAKPVLYRVHRAKKLWIFLWGLRSNRESTMLYCLPEVIRLTMADPDPTKAARALIGAAWHGSIRGVRGLLDGGLDVNEQNNGNDTPLSAAVDGRKKEVVGQIVQMLLEQGADVHWTDQRGLTPLHRAARNGILEAVEQLIRAGSEIHKADDFDNTPILLAAREGQYRTVEMLLDHGANVNDEDRAERTPLVHAAEKSHVLLLRLLLRRGADKDYANVFGRTALSLAAESGDVEIVEVLVQAGCDVEVRDMAGRDAIDYCRSGLPWTRVRGIINRARR